MAVSLTAKKWTLEELHSLPDDGNKYELARGDLFVTPAPTNVHETVISALHSLLEPYVQRHALGRIYRPRAVVRVLPDTEVEPDLFVRPAAPISEWENAPHPILVVEVTSPATRRRDHSHKRQLYLDLGIPLYWVFDLDARNVRVVMPGRPDAIVESRLVWEPTGVAEPLEISVSSVLSEAGL